MNLLEVATKIGVEGFLHPDEFEKLVELAINRDVLEIGSFKGLSAWGMAIVAKSLCCVDTFKANSAGQHQMETYQTLKDFQSAIERFSNVGYIVGSSEQAAGTMDKLSTFDLIFLDAMHTYEDVKADIARWWPRVRPGGLMVFHDYRHKDFPGVAQAVDECFEEIPVENTVGTLAWITRW